MSDVVSKKDLIKMVADEVGISNSSAQKVIEATIGAIEKQVAEGKEVRLVGFGTFKPVKRAARITTTPKGEKVEIPSRVVPTFKPGKKFKEMVGE